MRTILVVEDDRDMRTLLADEIGRDAAVMFAESGADAIAMIEQLPEIAAVVTDLELGTGPSGFDVLRTARSKLPRCARVLVTGRRDLDLDAATSPLVEAVFGKPWVLGSIRGYLTVRLDP